MLRSGQGTASSVTWVRSMIAPMIILALAACSGPPDSPQPSDQVGNPSQPVSTDAALATSAPTSEDRTVPTESVDWLTYRNQIFRFSFEYPAVYDLPENKSQCGLWEEMGTDGIVVHWGSRSTLAAFPSHGHSVEELITRRVSQDATDVEIMAVSADGVPGLKATFRFGGLARFGEIFAFVHQGRGYVALFTAGAACEPAGFSWLEPAVFDHALQTLAFAP